MWRLLLFLDGALSHQTLSLAVPNTTPANGLDVFVACRLKWRKLKFHEQCHYFKIQENLYFNVPECLLPFIFRPLFNNASNHHRAGLFSHNINVSGIVLLFQNFVCGFGDCLSRCFYLSFDTLT